jgi:preprotein translocase subunit SecD
MLEFARWKAVAAVLILVVAAIWSLPNLYPQDAAVQIIGLRGQTVDAALDTRVEGLLAEAGIEAKGVAIEDNALLVRLADTNDQIRAADLLRPALGSDFSVALNLASTVPAWLDAIHARPMTLGLDLQGGVHLLMQVDRAAAIEKKETALAEDVRGILRELDIQGGSVTVDANGMRVSLRNQEDTGEVRARIARQLPTITLDPADPDQNVVVGHLTEAEIARIVREAVDTNISTLRTRINSIGVAEPVITRQGEDRIVVQLPGIQDSALALRILGSTATLEFRPVIDNVGQDLQAMLRNGTVPPDARVYYERNPTGGAPIPILLSKRVTVSGDQLVNATATMSDNGTPAVSITLNSAGGDRMFEFTRENVGKRQAVVFVERVPVVRVVDGVEVRSSRQTEEVISAATIRGVFSSRFETSGLRSPEEASELAMLLRAGALAAPMDIVAERVIGPSLGAQNIENGWKAVTFSFLFVLAFFLVYYRTFGLITNLALLFNLLLVVAVMSVLGATLTLPGLAGIALTVGMSVDANVLINERIRDELRLGLKPLMAIREGYEKASGTIFDSNMTALLAGVALYVFGTGPIQGFAVSLVVGILTSVYTATTVSRGIATLIYGRRRKLERIWI